MGSTKKGKRKRSFEKTESDEPKADPGAGPRPDDETDGSFGETEINEKLQEKKPRSIYDDSLEKRQIMRFVIMAILLGSVFGFFIYIWFFVD